MAGYVGTKAVLLSTTAATVGGDADIGGDLTVDTSTLHVDSTNNRVGVGTISPSTKLDVEYGSGNSYPAATVVGPIFSDKTASENFGLNIFSDNASNASINFGDEQLANAGRIVYDHNGNANTMAFYTSAAERMRLDASGNLLVGSTTYDSSLAGQYLSADGKFYATVDGSAAARLNRLSNDGEIIRLQKDTTTVGSIGVNASELIVGTGDTGLKFTATYDSIHAFNISTNSNRDNAIDLGASTVRFDDIYATNGTIQTSDRNEKQDIAELSDAEQRVAVAAKGLMRKFRWRDAVEAKGDDARTHFGIIAQDLQAAFAAEALDAGDYAMFISTTWWETQTEVPAVEAVAEVLDEEGNVVTEAVEAKDAYTRTDTYDTQEEAPEGATERTRLGVRYSELLAFIIGAL